MARWHDLEIRGLLESFVGIVWGLIRRLWKLWLVMKQLNSLAVDMGVRKCVIASDCLEVIMNLQKQNLCAYSSILKEIKAMSILFQKVIFTHEGRQSNREACSC